MRGQDAALIGSICIRNAPDDEYRGEYTMGEVFAVTYANVFALCWNLELGALRAILGRFLVVKTWLSLCICHAFDGE